MESLIVDETLNTRSTRAADMPVTSVRGTTADLVPMPLALFERLGRAGLDVETILRRANLARSRFNVARPQATTAEFFALWRAVEQSGADAGLGLLLGIEALTDEQNPVVLAALHSPTLGDGLQRLARYKRIVCPEKVTIDIQHSEARLAFDWLFTNDDPPMLLTDAIFAGVVALAQLGTGTAIHVERLELTRRRTNEVMLRRHFGCKILFDAPRDVIVFHESVLALPMVRRNAQLLALLVPGLEQALGYDDPTRTVADDVREKLDATICGDRPTIAKVATSLGMSTRTLQRRLGVLGTTYQEILDDVRHRMARRLLTGTDLGIAEIAFLLGFGEVNSFARAFHGWVGCTPARWRMSRLSRTSIALSSAPRTPTSAIVHTVG
jgi:AraC-like DNA-binding protein